MLARLWLNLYKRTIKSIRIWWQVLRRRDVPVVLQMNALDCGAACLTMVFKYYGLDIDLFECSRHCGPGRDGLTALAIAKTAREFGLRVKAFTVEPKDIRYVQLPAIIHWKFNHYMVVEYWSSKAVHVIDPAYGRRKLKPDVFNQGFTGVILQLEPGVGFKQKHYSSRSSLFSYLGPILRLPSLSTTLFQIIAVSFMLLLFGLALPLFTKVLIDHIFAYEMHSLMPAMGLGLVFIVLIYMVMSYLRGSLLVYLQGRLDPQIMFNFFEHMLSLPLKFFQQRSTGDILMRLSSNVFIRQILTNQVISTMLDVTLLLGYFTILVLKAPTFAFVTSAIGLVQVAILLISSRWLRQITEQELMAGADSQSYIVEALRGISTLKASGAEDHAFNHWSNLFSRNLNLTLRKNHALAIIDSILTTLRTFAPMALLWFGGLKVLSHAMSLGAVLAYNSIAIAFLIPLSSLVSNFQQLQLIIAHIKRIRDVVECPPEQTVDPKRKKPKLTGAIQLKGVSFRYDKNSPLVLKNLSFSIPAGTKVAIVGPTGSGKTTLALLLLGLHIPTSGEILFDEHSLKELDLRYLRGHFGAVLQESFLFNGSIKQNISLCSADASLSEVIEAAKIAAIHDEIMQMPMGFETLVLESGQGLSGGQRQRLSIARAVVRKPRILLLDEATSHIDMYTEKKIDANLNAMYCTRIVIAHRLSTIRDADMIIVIRNGEIIEHGTHEQLFMQDGFYRDIAKSQDIHVDNGKNSRLVYVNHQH
ncbi:MAG TPA: peptidase domain-containing ABC transporter [bacterium]